MNVTSVYSPATNSIRTSNPVTTKSASAADDQQKVPFDVEQAKANAAAENPTDFSAVRDIDFAEYRRLKALNDKAMANPDLIDNDFFTRAMEMGKFEGTTEYRDYIKQQQLAHGAKKDIETVITIGQDKITITYDNVLTMPDKYANFSGSSVHQETIDRLLEAFGKENVAIETFEPGEGPTNAEFFEQTTGRNFYRHVMSEGRVG